MLSYQHAFHAGNLADVHKHALLAVMLDYLAGKDKPMVYIETHAGRGLYSLASDEAVRTGEAAAGIGAVHGWFAADHPYARRIAETRAMHGPAAYPGSPLIAALTLRPGDPLHLAELHPAEHSALVETMSPWGAHVRRHDGWAFALAVTPPLPRRGLMLIDPSWEVKTDYATAPARMAAVSRKWNVGVLVLWYPILADARHLGMCGALERDHPGALRHEVRFAAMRPGHGMVGSGLFVVNPPYGLGQEAARLSALFAGKAAT
jgi:23S rRNA (adenine2030-N6)-methyltransferase